MTDWAKELGIKGSNAGKTNTTAEPPKNQNIVEGLIDSVSSGFMYNWGDELTGIEAALLGRTPKGEWFNYEQGGPSLSGPRFDAAVKAERAQQKQFSDENPVTDFAVKTAGAIVNPLTRVGGRVIAGGKNMGARALRSTGVGVPMGAVAGSGDAEDRAMGGLYGGIGGALMGGITAPLTELGIAGARKLWQGVLNKYQGNFSSAEKHMMDLFKRLGDGDPKQGIRIAAQKIKEQGDDTAPVDVLGPKGEFKVEIAGTRPGSDAAGKIDEFVMQRQAGRGERMQSAADVIGPRRNMATLKDEQDALKRAAGTENYKTAFKENQNVDSAQIDKLLNTPTGKQALKNAIIDMQDDLANPALATPELTAALKEAQALGSLVVSPGGVAKGLKLKTLDYVKRAYYDMERSAKRNDLSDTARKITNQRRNLTKELDNLDQTATPGVPKSGSYAKAREEYQVVAREANSVEAGRKFISGDTDILEAQFAKMTAGEQQNFLIGARQKIREIINKNTKTAPNRFDPSQEDFLSRLRGILDKETFDNFSKKIQFEINKARTDKRMAPFGGSRTEYLKQGNIDPLSRVPEPLQPALGKIQEGELFGAVRVVPDLLKAGWRKAIRPRTDVARDLAGLLLELDPAKQAALHSRLLGQKLTTDKLTPDGARRLAGILSSTVAGKNILPNYLELKRGE